MKKESTPSTTPVEGLQQLNESHDNDISLLKSYYENLLKEVNEENRKAKMQIADLIETLQPFADIATEFPTSTLNQMVERFNCYEAKLISDHFVKALDLVHYLNYHQIK